MKHRAIIFTVGHTHTLYLDISDEEADRRFAEARAERHEMEILYEAQKGHKIQREVVEFDDCIQIWGGVQDEVNHLVQMALARLSLDGEDAKDAKDVKDGKDGKDGEH